MLAAAAALAVTHRHFAREDASVAITRVQTWRVAGTTRSRVDAWLSRAHPQAVITWAAEPPTLPGGDVQVRLAVDAAHYAFLVDPDARRVTPMDEATRALVALIEADAATAPP